MSYTQPFGGENGGSERVSKSPQAMWLMGSQAGIPHQAFQTSELPHGHEGQSLRLVVFTKSEIVGAAPAVLIYSLNKH